MDSQRMHVIANKPGKEPPLPIIGEPFESNYRPRVPLDNEEVEEAQNFSFFVEDASSMAGDILGRGEHLPGKGESTFNPKLSSKKSPQNNGPVSEVESENSFFIEDASGMANDIHGREEQMPEKGEPPGPCAQTKTSTQENLHRTTGLFQK
ncbi:hypothetical protein CJ030_MR2G024892 [Morella rubra]|uniref:Uncharacterized protein n=1 Tax=Morella rubra TaxID=262757 RepID=A0A6A1WB77_9ROSI|nr:hypothetical protein CJ030_MR2G024892 [Morella rubra]